ncbi:hypothetical protein ACJRO7_024137 [Eucalyptus globulus]|uniref:Uncharacterized protein n=1 Tax=Eucalyptus globulus TaxID=34317 RepID=A0ABD3K4C0_EUCGL
MFSLQKCEEYRAVRDLTLLELNEFLEVVKIEDVIELSLISHATMLIEMLPKFFVNCGNLDQIRIASHNEPRTRMRITSCLRRAGFVVEGSEVIIRFLG